MMDVAVVGAGCVGLTTGACLAALGHRVSIYDIDRDRIARIGNFDFGTTEQDLEYHVRSGVASGRIGLFDVAAHAVSGAEVVLVAVGTPSGANGEINTTQLEGAVSAIARHLRKAAVLVVKSTVPVGTCRRLRELIIQRRGQDDIAVASNPEFLREGSAVRDFMRPDRIVLGFDDERSGAVLDALYAPLAPQPPIVRTSTVNAELAKQGSNAFLAVKLGFVNDLADLCERVGADVREVARAIGLDPRIGGEFLAAGPGFGGTCLPKDLRAFAYAGRKHGTPQRTAEAADEGNRRRRFALARRIVDGARLKTGDEVAILGVAFKANTSVVSESPAVEIVRILQRRGIVARLHDPLAHGPGAIKGGRWFDSVYDAVAGARAAVILTEWEEYRSLSLQEVKLRMKGVDLFDFRNLLEPAEVARAGLVHHGIGRSTRPPSGFPTVVVQSPQGPVNRSKQMSGG